MTDRFRLWCRSACEGGDLDRLSAWIDALQLRGRPHLLFAVHGYNNTACEARDSYDRFCARQSVKSVRGDDWTFGAPVVEVYWPGDARWGMLRALFYPKALTVADQTSDLLNSIIRDLIQYANGRLTVDFVTHSMGARVVLGTVSKLQGVPGLYVRRCVHMAAAIPVHRLDDLSDEFRQGLNEEARLGKVASFYSTSDDVLAYAFPAGESLHAGSEGVLPVALGHAQWIAHNAVSSLQQFDAQPAGHSNYWNGVDTLEDQVRTSLAFPTTGSAVLPSRATSPARQLQSRGTDQRSTVSRNTGTQRIDCTCS